MTTDDDRSGPVGTDPVGNRLATAADQPTSAGAVPHIPLIPDTEKTLAQQGSQEPVATPLPARVTPRSKPGRPRRSPYRPPPGPKPKHGGNTLTRVLRGVKLDTIDRRSQVGVALRTIQADLEAQLGGRENISAAQAILIEQAAVKVVIPGGR